MHFNNRLISYNNMNFIIIGDKYQKGMKSKGCSGLIKINKTYNIFQNQYDNIKKIFPKANIVYVGGFESKKIENFLSKYYDDVLFVNNREYESFNDGHSMFLAKEFLQSETFIMLGYTLLEIRTFKKFNINLGSQLFITENSDSPIGCIITNNTINNITFDLPNYVEDIYYLSKPDSRSLHKLLQNNRYKNYFMFELINQLIDTGVVIKPHFYKKTKKSKYYAHTK